MKQNNQSVTQIYDKLIYQKNSPAGWSVIIMPDNILIDNFHHGFAHIHPDRKEIKTKKQKETFEAVTKHIHENKGINFEKLKKELIK